MLHNDTPEIRHGSTTKHGIIICGSLTRVTIIIILSFRSTNVAIICSNVCSLARQSFFTCPIPWQRWHLMLEVRPLEDVGGVAEFGFLAGTCKGSLPLCAAGVPGVKAGRVADGGVEGV
ncbi:hypothetical protein PVAP13_4KG123005 [Panicum virgatum]|uniref:Uncharacterized protein n=1 Tax=Panicum virgatum TaxID=38727 RepID=A0A8T0TKY8_PANVG|nr:hypothetical protein PVAP13_4KG123005 [Panicum virgatum]